MRVRSRAADTDFRILSACLLGNSILHTSTVSFPRRHSSLVLMWTIWRRWTSPTGSIALEPLARGMIADGVVDVACGERRKVASTAGSRMKASTSCVTRARKAPTSANIAPSSFDVCVCSLRVGTFQLMQAGQALVAGRVRRCSVPALAQS